MVTSWEGNQGPGRTRVLKMGINCPKSLGRRAEGRPAEEVTGVKEGSEVPRRMTVDLTVWGSGPGRWVEWLGRNPRSRY